MPLHVDAQPHFGSSEPRKEIRFFKEIELNHQPGYDCHHGRLSDVSFGCSTSLAAAHDEQLTPAVEVVIVVNISYPKRGLVFI